MEALASLTELLFPFDAMSGLAHYYHSLPLAYVFTTVQFILTACAIRREPGRLLVCSQSKRDYCSPLFQEVCSLLSSIQSPLV